MKIEKKINRFLLGLAVVVIFGIFGFIGYSLIDFFIGVDTNVILFAGIWLVTATVSCVVVYKIGEVAEYALIKSK